MDWLLLAGFLIAFFVDNVIIAFWSFKMGPKRARDLIINDPVFAETREAQESLQTNLAAVRHDLEAQREAVKQELRQSSREIDEKVARRLSELKTPDTLSLTPDAEQRIIQSVQRTLRGSIKESMSADLVEALAETQEKTLEQQEMEAEAQIAKHMLFDRAVQAGIPNEWLQMIDRFALPVAKRLLVRFYPEVAEDLFEMVEEAV
jgi:hypothetical protein